MNYHRLGKTELMVPTISYAGIVSTMSGFAGYTYEGDGQKASDHHVEYALSQGIDYFDVAPQYGDALYHLGNSLEGKRDRIHLASKTLFREAKQAKEDFKTILELLKTPYLDVFQMHGLSTMEELDVACSDEGVLKLMVELKKAGLIHHIGFTAHSEDVALEALRRFDFESVLFPINWMMHMGYGYGERLIKLCRERDVGLLSMKSVIERHYRPGDDRSRFPKSWCKPLDPKTQGNLLLAAMKYAYSLGPSTLIPAGNEEHLKFACEMEERIAKEPLTSKEWELLKQVLPDAMKNPIFKI